MYRYLIVLLLTIFPSILIIINDVEKSYIYLSFLFFVCLSGIYINYYRDSLKVKEFIDTFF